MADTVDTVAPEEQEQDPGETLAQRMARIAKERGLKLPASPAAPAASAAPASEPLEQRMARIAKERGIALGAPPAAAPAPAAPAAPVGTPAPAAPAQPFVAEAPPVMPSRLVAPNPALQPAGPYATANAKAFVQTPAPAPLTVAPKDNVAPAAPNPQAHQLTGVGKFASDVFQAGARPLENPAAAIASTAAAIPTAIYKTQRFAAEQDAANAIASSGGDPSSVERTVTPKDAAESFAQLVAVGAAGPAEDAMRDALAASIARRAIAKGIGSTVGLDRLAAVAARMAASAPIGAAFNPDHPFVGAAVQSIIGAVHAGATGARVSVGESPYSLDKIADALRTGNDLPGAPEPAAPNAPSGPNAPSAGGPAAGGGGGGGGGSASPSPTGRGSRTLPTTGTARPSVTVEAAATKPSLLDQVIEQTKLQQAEAAKATPNLDKVLGEETPAPASAPAKAPAPAQAAPAATTPASDLTPMEVIKIAQVHGLDDVARPLADKYKAANPDEDDEARRQRALRTVVDRYRDLVHGGATTDDAKQTVTNEFAPAPAETLDEKMKRVAKERGIEQPAAESQPAETKPAPAPTAAKETKQPTKPPVVYNPEGRMGVVFPSTQDKGKYQATTFHDDSGTRPSGHIVAATPEEALRKLADEGYDMPEKGLAADELSGEDRETFEELSDRLSTLEDIRAHGDRWTKGDEKRRKKVLADMKALVTRPAPESPALNDIKKEETPAPAPEPVSVPSSLPAKLRPAAKQPATAGKKPTEATPVDVYNAGVDVRNEAQQRLHEMIQAANPGDEQVVGKTAQAIGDMAKGEKSLPNALRSRGVKNITPEIERQAAHLERLDRGTSAALQAAGVLPHETVKKARAILKQRGVSDDEIKGLSDTETVERAFPAAPDHDTAPAQTFADHYERELRQELKDNPSSFAYGYHQIPGVVAKMMKGLAAGNANWRESKALKRAAKAFGVPFTKEGLQNAAASVDQNVAQKPETPHLQSHEPKRSEGPGTEGQGGAERTGADVRGSAPAEPRGESADATPVAPRLRAPGGVSQGRGAAGGRPVSGTDGTRDAGDGAHAGLAGDAADSGNRAPDRGSGRDAGTRPRAGSGHGARNERGRLPLDEQTAPSTPSVSPESAVAPRADTIQSAGDFRITDDTVLAAGGPKARIAANLAAIKLARDLAASGRAATPDEQQVLARYVGWGDSALAKVFDEDSDTADKWATERAELKRVLSDEEYRAARRSTRNAHYTSPEVIRAIYEGLRHLGVTSDAGPLRVLEPAVGIGHFIGLRPDGVDMKWTAVELDPTTASIAKGLYPSVDIRAQGFETVVLPDDSFDLIVGNPPFGDTQLAEERYDEHRLLIHDHFFVKDLDKLRPGGLLAFVTSNGTMDKLSTKARQLMADRADFIGGVRLPNTAFKQNAGTQVVTDILFFRKRGAGEPLSEIGEPFVNTREIRVGDGHARINEYFADHPEQVIGEHALTGSMYRADSYTVEPRTDAKTGEPLRHAITEALTNLPANVYTPAGAREGGSAPLDADAITDVTKAPAGLRDGWMVVHEDGRIMAADRYGNLQPAKVAKAHLNKVKALVALREARQQLAATQLTEEFNEKDFKAALREANKRYDAFVEKYGPIRTEKVSEGVIASGPQAGKAFRRVTRPNLDPFRADPSYPLVMSLEDYDPATGKAQKADFLKGRQLHAPAVISRVDRVEDALPASLNMRGRVDLAYMAEITGVTPDEVADALRGTTIFEDPNTHEWEPADVYLSGNVKAKLATAKRAAEGDRARFSTNVAALEKVQPADIAPSDIYVKLGSPWVPIDVFAEFATETFGGKVTVRHTELAGGQYRAEFDNHAYNSAANTTEYGSPGADGRRLFNDALNQRATEVSMRDPDTGSQKKDPEATMAALEKQAALKARFAEWVWENPDRAARLARIYNDVANTSIAPNVSGAHLTIPGTASRIRGSEFRWSPWQLDAVWRVITKGNTLLAHVVGAGKTFTMQAAGMEMRRLGLAKKPLYVVPNHMLEQFSSEFQQLYPNAHLLVATKKDFAKSKRREFTASMASQDWDGIVMTHSSFELIATSAAFQKKYIAEQMDALRDAIVSAQAGKSERQIVKALEGALEKLQVKLQRLMAASKKDDLLSFEETGVDQIFVDEAHLFKNLFIISKMRGQAQEGAERSFDLYLKTQYLQQRTPGRGVVFATGTPVSNSMAEVYTMQRYLQPDILRQLQAENFDDWAAMFGETVVGAELAPDGSGYRTKERFSRFQNLPELSTAFRQAADVRGEEIFAKPPEGQRQKRPPIVGGRPTIVTVPATLSLKGFVRTLIERAEAVRRREVDPEDDNFLKITGEGRYAAMDLRMVSALAHPDAHGKITAAVENIVARYHEYDKVKGVQLVFSDIGTPASRGKKKAEPAKPSADAAAVLAEHFGTGGKEGAEGDDETIEGETPDGKNENVEVPGVRGLAGFTVYEEAKRQLIAAGIPAKEIAFIHDAATPEAKQRLFNDAKAGRIRVLIGSTEKMGAGTNVQDRLVALHHLDAPWRPSDLEQREGRIVRQGNKLWDEAKISGVHVYRYGTEESFDAYMWQTIERKAQFITAFMKGDPTMRSMEDMASTMDIADMKAATSGNPKVKEKQEIDVKVAKLQLQQRQFRDGQAAASARIASLASYIQRNTDYKRGAEADKAKVVARDLSGDKFDITIGKKSYQKRDEANEALTEVLGAIMETPETQIQWSGGRDGQRVLGKLGEFPVMLMADRNYRSDKTVFYGFRLALDGSKELYQTGEFNKSAPMKDPVSALMRQYAGIPDVPRSYQQRIDEDEREKGTYEEQRKKTWNGGDELAALKARQSELAKELKASDDQAKEEPIYHPLSRDWWDALARGEWPYTKIERADAEARDAQLDAALLDAIRRAKSEDDDEDGVTSEMRIGSAETIKAAAVRLPNGRVVTGLSHYDALAKARKEGFVDRHWNPDYDFDDGWLTSRGRFVNREKGYLIAERAGQVPKSIFGRELTHDDIILSEMRTAAGRAGMGVNRQRLADTMSANVYQGGLPQIIVKEAIQNAIDAVRPRGGGTITVKLDEPSREITVTDDGTGMTPEIATGAFLDAFESEKPEGSTGGLGIAKAALFRYASPFAMTTVAEVKPQTPERRGLFSPAARHAPKKVRTTVHGTGDDWINGTLHVKEEAVPDDTPTGTTYRVRLDESLTGDNASFYTARSFLTQLQRNSIVPSLKFKVEDISRFSHGTSDYPSFPSEVPDTPLLTESVPGATVDIYVGEPEPFAFGSFVQARILNNGYFQFAESMRFGPEPPSLWVNIKPTVPVTDPAYPFTIDRTKLKNETKAAIEKAIAKISNVSEAKSLDTLVRSLAEAPSIPGGGQVIATDGGVPRALAEKIAQRPYAASIAAWWDAAGQAIAGAVQTKHPMPEPAFVGIGLGGGYLAVNVLRGKLVDRAKELGLTIGGDTRNAILINPFNILREAQSAKPHLARDPEHLADQTWGALVHEIAHQNQRGHGEAFAGEYTRIDARAARMQGQHLAALDTLWRTLLADPSFLDDAATLADAWKQAKNKFKGYTGHESHRLQQPHHQPEHGRDAADQSASAPVSRRLSRGDASGDAVQSFARTRGSGESRGLPHRRLVSGSSRGSAPESGARGAELPGFDEREAGDRRLTAETVGSPETGGPAVGSTVDIYAFADPFTAAYKMWQNANALRQARLAQSVAIRPVQAPQAPALQRTRELGRDVRESVYALLAPAAIDANAAKTGRIKNARLGEKALEDERARNTLLDAHAAMEKMPVAERYAFVDRYERGQPQPTLYLQSLADTIHTVMDHAADRIKGLGKGHLRTFREHYWGRFLVSKKNQLGQAFRETMTRRPLEGAKSFKKKRSFEYLKDALDAGYEPITKNPVDWLLLKVREMNRYIAAHEMKNELRAEGLAKFYRPSKRLPEGWDWLDDRIFVAYGARDKEGAQRIRGKYAAPTPVARIINNYLSPGLRGNPLYDGYMFLGNTMNMLQLGFSAFHLGFVSFDATISQGALGLEQVLTKGQRAKGALNIGAAASSMALGAASSMVGVPIPLLSPAMLYRKGAKLRHAYKYGTTDATLERMVEAVAQSGGRVGMDELYKSDAVQKFRLALRDRRWAKTVFEAPFAAVELSMKPILEHIVPRLKLGAFYALAERELAKLPTGASEDDIRRALQAVWATIDDRLGQVVYDNYHWHNATKQALMGAIRAVGWNRGSISLTLGGVTDALGAPIRAYRLHGPGGRGAGGAGRGGKKGGGGGAGGGVPGVFNANGDEVIDHKLAYVIAAGALMALYGGIYTYLHTGERPGTHNGKEQGLAFLLKDLYVPRTGTTNRDHSLERITPATYIKDVIAFGHHPVDTVLHKMQPAIALIVELIENKDYFGDEIRNPHDPILKEALQDATAVLKAYQPIARSNYLEATKRGAGLRERVENFLGNSPASREMVRTPAQNLMLDYLGQHSGGLSPEERDAANLRTDLRHKIQDQEISKADVRKLVVAGELTPRQGTSIASAARRDPRLLQYQRLTPEQAMDVWSVANEEERALFKKIHDGRQRQIDRLNRRRLRAPGTTDGVPPA